MTEEKDFWINKAEVYALSNAEGTLYKVTQETMNKKGWYKLADDEQVVKKAVLSKEEAEWFEKYKDLPFYDLPLYADDSSNHFTKKLSNKMVQYREDWKKRADLFNRLSQAYFTGYTIEKEKEKKYYINIGFDDIYLKASRVNGMLYWGFDPSTPSGRSQFTQDEIDEMQKDPRAKGLDLNVLKVEVPEDELED
ncbi:DUF1642 domain-containing protein [Ligilactobacillus murinus]|uniref:DUF1642 domain-containing protein n=1 Tax=Ligilactobacillus murinus TaxID=1622 RepID=UPI00144260C4|nr:DUF1642 domain-containing protein [Ligilactobacillus murinus]